MHELLDVAFTLASGHERDPHRDRHRLHIGVTTPSPKLASSVSRSGTKVNRKIAALAQHLALGTVST